MWLLPEEAADLEPQVEAQEVALVVIGRLCLEKVLAVAALRRHHLLLPF